MSSKQLKHDSYNVGWVCALPKEQTAAIAMLDETHANLPKPSNDQNTYTLGCICGHNVVIACLPKGKIGLAPAATVVSSMTNTFPSLRFVLMVGIGGGIPPKVRLGDVVVSVPSEQSPGVVQWDMGKFGQDNQFTRTGALNNPPTLLLTAITRLESKHAYAGSRIPEYLEALGVKYPRLAAKYLRSDSLKDVLFRAQCRHESSARNRDEETDEEDDGTCRNCDATQVIHRKPRGMEIHYGTIASGNKVIKDAVFRDKLVQALGTDVLCVEMEAAGLMDNFRCIVIRGICDYADAHKNKAWQEHAAAVAAAYAKELLEVVDPRDVEGEAVLKDARNKLSYAIDSMERTEARLRRLQHLDWIASDAFGGRQSDTLRRRHPETASWFLSSNPYQDWIKTSKKTLYCPGIPGAGKTIISSVVIDDLYHRFPGGSEVGVAHVYCMFSQQHVQSLEYMLASLLRQLAGNLNPLPTMLTKSYDFHERNSTRPLDTELYELLRCVIAEFKRIFFIFDALDECSMHDAVRKRLLDCLFKLQLDFGINLLATSRNHGEIATRFMEHNATILPIRAQDEDLKYFLEDQISAHGLEQLDDDLRHMVVKEIINASDGMFLLAKLHIDDIARLPTRGDIRQALPNLIKRYETLEGREICGLRKSTKTILVPDVRTLEVNNDVMEIWFTTNGSGNLNAAIDVMRKVFNWTNNANGRKNRNGDNKRQEDEDET
ncbi:hypothetical protein HJFPF1_10844 [Paramyrothecium foliicola]|nr:hypothetical protein HJFPF1_10844 [Paramyrothecium foliicola]